MKENKEKMIKDDSFISNVLVKIKKLDSKAIIPKYQTEGSSAFDMHALIDEGEVIKIPAHTQKIIKTGISMAIPQGYELRISPRSGQSAKYQISIRNSPGIIDADYRGEILIILVNNGDNDFIINPNDRICQVKLSESPRAIFKEVDELCQTIRNDGKFGSTGT